MQSIIFLLVWVAGFLLSYLMERTETAAEKEPFTFGARLLIIAVSLLSFFWVLVILIRAWIQQIQKTGHWNEPVKQDQEIIVVGEKKRQEYSNVNDN